MGIENRIGVSTISMTGVDITTAISMIAEKGFKVIEICAPHAAGVVERCVEFKEHLVECAGG